jgi:hypothetical protein
MSILALLQTVCGHDYKGRSHNWRKIAFTLTTLLSENARFLVQGGVSSRGDCSFGSMKKNIQIAALRRKIRQAERDWPLFLKRIADYTPEQQQLVTRLYKSSLEKDQAELRSLLDDH